MKKKLLKGLILLTCLSLMIQPSFLTLFAESAEKNAEIDLISETDLIPSGAPILSCESAILMEASTGAILYSKNAHASLPPASVTKIMTLLLIMEAVDSELLRLNDVVTASANAASMGGSQVYLKEGEQMPLEDMLKCVIIASANDAAVALAEHYCGSVSSFVEKMNERAKQLGMKDTTFENVTGLDDTAQNHLTSAHDIALMSQALIRHKTILKYSSIWMDTIRDGSFGLTNTNRLVRFYKGCTGLKTGSTEKAGFCVSVTAEREGLSLISVIMGAETRDQRNAEAAALLDWGFANYGLLSIPATEMSEVYVSGGVKSSCKTISSEFVCVLPKSEISQVEKRVLLPDQMNAPIKVGDSIGVITYYVGDREIGRSEITALESVDRMTFFDIIQRFAASMLLI